MGMTEEAEELDLTGLKCPLPSLMTAKALRRLTPGSRLAIVVTDPLAPLDIKFLCEREGHDFLEEMQIRSGMNRLLLRKRRQS
jgi:tRNA 2-thiouridine synthesizing protein A